MSHKDDLSGKKLHKKTGWFTEDNVGRTDDDGRLYERTGWLTEEEAGRVDEDGRVYKRTGWLTEEQTHRIDSDGRIYEKTGWFSEDEVGRIDDDGRVYKKTGWFSETEVGRVSDDDDSGSLCFLSSACTRAMGLADDCEELTALRAFRRDYLQHSPEGQALLSQYADLAPRVLAALSIRSDSQTILADVYSRLVIPAVALIRRGEFDAAVDLYRTYVGKLAAEIGAA